MKPVTKLINEKDVQVEELNWTGELKGRNREGVKVSGLKNCLDVSSSVLPWDKEPKRRIRFKSKVDVKMSVRH